MQQKLTPAALARKVYEEDPLAWWTKYGNILDKNNQEVCPPKSNFLQQEVTRAIRFFREHDRPVRIIVLKPRQRGSSTFSTAALYHECRRKRTRATIIGGQYSQVSNLFRITSRYAAKDKFDWGFTATVGAEKIEFGNGSFLDRETARDEDAGRSGTIQALVVTELGRWKEGLTISPTRVLAGILACVPPEPETMVILESTPNGMQGTFYERWQAATTIEQVEKTGNWKSGYIRVFCPWFAFEDTKIAITSEEKAEILRTLTDREKDLIDNFHCNLNQLAWRRNTIASELDGDADLFEQEYPTDDVSAFLGSGRLRFPAEHVKRQEDEVMRQCSPYLGTLDQQSDYAPPIFRPAIGTDWWFQRWEEPLVGRRYLVSADPATGEQAAAADDPDANSVVVLRAGYRNHAGWHAPKVVARIKPPCYVPLDVLAVWIRLISAYYGNCLVVPEANNSGMALIELLKPMGVPIYERQTWNMREARKIKILGWQTTEATRHYAMDRLGRALREFGNEQEGVEIPCPHAIDELRFFIVNAKGRAEAAPGKHDDDVLAIGIALACEEAATEYVERMVPRVVPRDIRKADLRERGGRYGRPSAECG
jgi:hypothetical protein